MKITGMLYQMARATNDLNAFGSLNPEKISRRIVNKGIGRMMVKNVYLKGKRRSK